MSTCRHFTQKNVLLAEGYYYILQHHNKIQRLWNIISNWNLVDYYYLAMSSIACCLCGRQIQANAAAMCMDCLKIEVDITTNIAKNCDVLQCGKCGRWQLRNNQWVHHGNLQFMTEFIIAELMSSFNCITRHGIGNTNGLLPKENSRLRSVRYEDHGCCVDLDRTSFEKVSSS